MLKQNNPLNIRNNTTVKYIGEIPTTNAFKAFETMAYGYRAAFMCLKAYKRMGYKSIRQIISRWAPEDDNNNTELYIKFICKNMKTTDTHIIENDEEYIPLVAFMSRMENGVDAVITDVINGYNMIYNYKPTKYDNILDNVIEVSVIPQPENISIEKAVPKQTTIANKTKPKTKKTNIPSGNGLEKK